MYAANGMFLSYLQNFSPDIQDYCKSPQSYFPMNNPIPEEFSVSEYDIGVEEDLFKAPEPIMEDEILAIDPMSVAMAIISCDDDIICPMGPPLADQHFLDEVFYSCEEELMAKALMDEETHTCKGSDKKMTVGLPGDGNPIQDDDQLFVDVPFQNSVSTDDLVSSGFLVGGTMLKPDFLDFPMMDFERVNGMRRAFSEGDIETLSNGGNVKSVESSLDRLILEDRKEKLSRYRNKKAKRSFGRKIKYACRKVLADNQPRVRGRFAKSQESDVSKT